MSYDALLPHSASRQPGERYSVGVPGKWQPGVEAVLKQIIAEAQQHGCPFTPDDLTAELTQAFAFLAKSPRAAPALNIYSEIDTPQNKATHVLPGRIVNVWYRIWEAEEFVWLRIEPAVGRWTHV